MRGPLQFSNRVILLVQRVLQILLHMIQALRERPVGLLQLHAFADLWRTQRTLRSCTQLCLCRATGDVVKPIIVPSSDTPATQPSSWLTFRGTGTESTPNKHMPFSVKFLQNST